MKSSIHRKKRIQSIVIVIALTCLAPLLRTQAVVPPPDGGYASGNTAEGQSALFSLTAGGYNAAIGWLSLKNLTTGSFNTAVGAGTLALNTADNNTAIGTGALLFNSSGTQNSGSGGFALFNNTTGFENTADGFQALYATTTGNSNTGIGRQALLNNTTGFNNTAIGRDALANNTTGSNNIGVGIGAGAQLTTGDNNIDIGHLGSGGEANTIRIGDSQTNTFIAGISGAPVTGTPIVVTVFGQLGVAPSSQRFKEEIAPMDKASESLLALEPVSFRYKKNIDPAGTRQFGLVAEEVEKVNPALVVRDKEGKAYSVRYDQVNAMLLNEFLKEHRSFVKEQRKVEDQQQEIDALKKELKEQRALVQTITDKIEASQSMTKAATSER